MTTSGAAYGYHADNPKLLVESDPVRGHEDFAYASHKRQVEDMLVEFRDNNPDTAVLVLRPGTILGQHTANQITALFEKPAIIALEESATPFTFVWDEDVCAAIVHGMQERIDGTFNLAGDGVLTIREIAGLLGKPCLSLPANFVAKTLELLEEQGATRYGPEQVDFLRYRPVMSTDSYRAAFAGLRRALSSREVFELYLRHNPHVLAAGTSTSAEAPRLDLKELERSVVVITGAAGGIGRAMAERFLADGARVALLDLDPVALERTLGELRRAGTRAMAVTCDVSDAGQCQHAIGEVIAHWGGIDVLVNNAGITHMSLVADTAAETLSRVMDVNFHGAVHCTRAALESIVARKGTVVAVSSVAGFAPLVGRCAYAASKHALHGYFDTLRAEMRDRGVHVMVVCPAYTETSIQKRALRPELRSSAAFEGHQPGRLASPVEVADAVALGVAKRRDQIVLSPVGKASWWLSRIAPRLFEWTMRRAHR